MRFNIEYFLIGLSYFFRLSIIFVALYSLYEGKWFTSFLSFGIFIVTFLPSLIERNYKINFPIEFELLIIFFLYASLFLGEVQSYYQIYWWWDLMLHTLSGVILGLIAFLIVFMLNYEKKVNLSLRPIFLAVFSLSFAVSIGAIWEIFEYLMDYYVGTNMQKDGLNDTMADLIVDTLGALFVSVLGYFYVKKKDILMFDGLIIRFIEKNPHMFKKKKK